MTSTQLALLTSFALVAQARVHIPVGCVLADAEFDSECIHTFIRQQLHAYSVIPAKCGKETCTKGSIAVSLLRLGK
jgi:hypothetical protein